jgi:phasin
MAYMTDDIFSFSNFDPAKFTEGLREFTEKGANQSREAYDRMRAAAEEATRSVGSTVHSAQAGTVELGIQALEAVRTSTDISLTHMEALLAARSMSEFVELQTSFLRRQAELTVEQAKLMQDTARRLAETVTNPSSDAADKAPASAKSA